MRGRRTQAAAACPPPLWPPSPLAGGESTQGQVGGAGKGRRKLFVLEVQTEARRSEGDGQKVGDCQSETETPQPIPVNHSMAVLGWFAMCIALKHTEKSRFYVPTCLRKYSADADPLAPELKLSTNLKFQTFLLLHFTQSGCKFWQLT